MSAWPGWIAPCLCVVMNLGVAAGEEHGLQAVDKGGAVLGHCPLKHTAIEAEISGTVARVRVTQKFHNPFPGPIEAVYTFPLHQNSAVDEMTLATGDSVVKGVVRERKQAELMYEKARKGGQVAALLNQERPNVFNQHVANILPGRDVTVSIGYTQMVAWEDGRYRFEVPTVVGPRYLPGGGHAGPVVRDANPVRGPDGEVAVVNPMPVVPFAQVPDADRIAPPVAELGYRAGHDLSVTVRIEAGLPILDVKSAQHGIVTEHPDGNPARAVVRLAEGVTVPDRDFVLSYGTAGEGISDAVLTHTDGRGKFFTLVLEPPDRVEARDILPRELVFVLDVSGSMSGFPLETSKALVRRAIESLCPADRFNVITFAGGVERLSSTFLANTEQNRHRALRFVDSRHGAGGTEMMKGIEAALASAPEAGRIRMVCFLTDGFIGNDGEIIAAVRKHAGSARVFCFGIGSSVNRHLLDCMSAAGRGKADYVLGHSDAESAADRFRQRIDAPVLADIGIDFGGLDVTDVLPDRVQDLFADEPIVVRGRYGRAGEGVVRLKGRNVAGPYEREMRVVLPEANPANQVLAAQWARAKIQNLSLDTYDPKGGAPSRVDEIVSLGIEYQLLTRFTSFVAVEEKRTVENGELRTIQVPVEMPYGVSHEGVFGKSASFGGGWGAGSGSGGGFSNVPMTMSHRCTPEDRLKRIRESGGDAACDAAVEKSLDWLASHQNKDGSWGDVNRCAATGLALLVYLGRCETPMSVKYGEAVTKAITYLIQHASRNRGVMTDSPGTTAGRLEHAIALAGLAEAYCFCRQSNITIPDLDATVVRAGELMIRDASAGGAAIANPFLAAVQLQALKSCQHSSLFPDRKLRTCVNGVFRGLGAWNAAGKAKSDPLGAGAVGLAHVQWSRGQEKMPRLLRKEIARDFLFRWDEPAADLPALYFNTCFLFAEGGAEWAKWDVMMRTELLGAQRADGSFGPVGAAGGVLQGDGKDAVVLRTCLAALTLEVYYRYLYGTVAMGAK